MLGAATGGVDNASWDYVFKLLGTYSFISSNLMDGVTSI